MALQANHDYILSPKVRDHSSTIESIFIGTKDFVFSYPKKVDKHTWRSSSMSGTVKSQYFVKEGKEPIEYFQNLLQNPELTLAQLEAELKRESETNEHAQFFRIRDFKKFIVKMGFISNTIYVANKIFDAYTFNGFPRALKPEIKAFYGEN